MKFLDRAAYDLNLSKFLNEEQKKQWGKRVRFLAYNLWRTKTTFCSDRESSIYIFFFSFFFYPDPSEKPRPKRACGQIYVCRYIMLYTGMY